MHLSYLASVINVSNTQFGQWLTTTLQARNDLDLAELGRRVGSDYNYMWRLSTGRRKRPSYELTVSIGQQLQDVPGALDAAGYPLLIEGADPLSKIGPEVDTTVLRRIPFIPGPVSASMTRVGEGENVGPLQTAADVLPNDVRAIEVRGESMEPVYRSGDILFVQEARTAHDGDEVIAVIGLDGITCKTYREPPEGLGYLQPYNGEAKIEFPNFIIVGIVVGFYRHKQRRPN